jgi:hypothetical protein
VRAFNRNSHLKEVLFDVFKSNETVDIAFLVNALALE